MISHLNIKALGKDLNLPDDFSIDIEDSNPLFNNNEMYSFPVSVPLEGNRFLVQNMEDLHSDVRAVAVEHTPMTLYVDGLPFRHGVCVVDEGQELKDTFSFSLQSATKDIQDMISDLDCQDVPLKDKIQIGEMIGDVKVRFAFDYKIYTRFKEGNSHPRFTPDKKPGQRYAETVVQDVPLQALGFSYPFVVKEDSQHLPIKKDGALEKVEDFINVSRGYSPSTPYCNTRVCYQHYKKNEDGSSGEETSFEGQYAPFFVLDADRPQSGICFYVLYFLDCLFQHLQVGYDNSDLLKVEDLKNLFFFNTSCKYELERKDPTAIAPDFTDIASINEWVSSRATDASHCGQLSFVPQPSKEVQSVTIGGITYAIGVRTKNWLEGDIALVLPYLTLSSCAITLKNWEYSIQANVMKMMATSENFPKESVSAIIDSMWNSFGVKFLMNYETQTMKAVLIRDVYRNTAAPIDFPCEVISCYKVAEKITGVKMNYSAESDEKEQQQNVKHGVKDYDTNFDYVDYRQLNDQLTYGEIIRKRSNTDMTTYVDRTTGNAYRLKVDSEAETVSELNARLFEVGGYKGISIGDCSSANEDYVEHLEIDWSPMLFTDVNLRSEMAVGSDKPINYTEEEKGTYATISSINSTAREQVMAAFVDEEMWHENLPIHIDNAVSSDFADASLRETLTTDECYDPTSTEDGNSPLQHIDWGTAVGIMRGGGTNMTIQEYDINYDGFGNSKWRTVAGKYAATSDSIDNWGSGYDYNGEEPGDGGGERFSLKVRAFKDHPETGEPMCVDSPEIKDRGLFDTFMSEHAYFLLNRKKYKIVCRCEISVLADIPNHWDRRFNVGGIVGWINRISSSVNVKEGLGLVEIEMYSI